MAKPTVSRNSRSQEIVQRLIDFLGERNTQISPLLILTHDFPDPDALASGYALQYLAERGFGIRSRIVYKGIIGRAENENMVKFLDLPVHPIRPRELTKYQHVALVDTQPSFENNPFPSGRQATLVIDQHPSANSDGSSAELLLVDTACGATCVILARAIQRLDLPWTERLATALAYGIITDTRNLYRAPRPDIIDTYLDVLSYANLRTLARIQTPLYGKNYFSSLHRGIENARLSQGMVVCHLGKVTSPDVVSQIAEFLLSFRGAKWVLSTGRFRKRLHLSFRTTTMEFPAAQVLRACVNDPDDAGGHGYIAGGAVPVASQEDDEFTKVEKQLETKLWKRLALRTPRRFSTLHE